LQPNGASYRAVTPIVSEKLDNEKEKTMKPSRLSGFALAVLVFCAATAAAQPAGRKARAQGPSKKLIILGFDGLDPRLTKQWMEAGKLPNFTRLSKEGCFARLATSNPAQSPVAWSCFATGNNPGKTRIFGFLKRKCTDSGPVPEIALGHRKWVQVFNPPALRYLLPVVVGGVIYFVIWVVLHFLAHVKDPRRTALMLAVLAAAATGWAFWRWFPSKLPVPVSDKQGKDFWQTLAEKDIKTTALLAPMSFPAKPMRNLKLLTGLGTPDIRGTTGIWSFYSTFAVSERDTEMGGLVIPLEVKNGVAKSYVAGPRSMLRRGKRLTVPVRFCIHRDGKVTITAGGRNETLSPGEWSGWFKFKFHASPMLSVSGMGRFCLVSAEPSLQVYLTPVNFDPSALPPTVRLSSPPGFAALLMREAGPFDTLGWAASTNVLAEEMINEESFLADLFAITARRRKVMEKELAKRDWQCFIAIFYETDRIQHMMWRFLDKEHPKYDEALAEKFGDAILQAYQQADDIVGLVLDSYVDKNTLLMVVSDHGFAPFRKMVNLNNWLQQEGYLSTGKTESDMKIIDLFQPRMFFDGVDWKRTKAYAMGLGKMFINLKGRERDGIVEQGMEYEGLRNEIIAKLRALRDPDTGKPVILGAYKREEIMKGPYVSEEADIIVGFNEGYRVSWQTALGGFGKAVIEDNKQKWSGDHCSIDPSVVPGIFFSNRRAGDYNIGLRDIAPTVLSYFDVSPIDCEGHAIEWVKQ